MYNTIPEFSFAVLLEALKLIIMMCGIFNFSIKKEKKWPFVSLGVAVCLISILVAVPLLLHVDPAIGVDNDIFQSYYTDRPVAAVVAKIFSLNTLSLPLTVIFSVLHLITGKKKILLLFLSELSIGVIDEIVHAGVCRIFNTEYSDYYLLTTSMTIIILALPAYIIHGKKKKELDYPVRKMGAFYLIMLVIAQLLVLYYASLLHNSFGINRTYLTFAIAVIIMIEGAMIYTSSRKD
ncbi:MAG: hypothetical protein IKH50_01135, partial [Oscillospiraceae bacterium]|nr:hypothetical protein [Oscillospiraceae bacterium]